MNLPILCLALLFAGVSTAQSRVEDAAADPRDGWVVTFAGPGGDHADLARLLRSGARREVVTAEIDRLRDANAERHSAFAMTLGRLGGEVTAWWWLVDGCAIRAPRASIATLAAVPGVSAISVDRTWLPAAGEALDPVAPIRTSTDAMHHNADGLHALGILGAGATLACIDSGQDHPHAGLPRPHRMYFLGGDPMNASGAGIAGSRLLQNVALGLMGADDVNGHGTAMTAIAAGGGWGTPGSDAGHAPQAGILGYAIADTLNGSASSSTMVAAWQLVVADAGQHGTDVVLFPYDGSSDPLDPVQRALDNAVLIADLLVVTPAGNTGLGAQGSQSAVNAVAVASCDGSRVLAANSARGPLPGDTARTFPDLTAHGVAVVTARVDDETVDSVVSGTCAAAAQVAGAALLYRSLRPQASALEVKAALLATAEDIAGANPGAGANDFGVGYLRDDALADVHFRPSFLAESEVTWANPTVRYRLRVTPNQPHTVVLAWHRHDVSTTAWSDLGLTVFEQGGVLASSNSPRNLYERVVFTPTTTEIEVAIAATALECPKIPFALLIPKGVGEPPAVYSTFGPGCQGNCPQANTKAEKLDGTPGIANRRYAIRMQPLLSSVTTLGFWLCTVSATGTTIPVSIWNDSGGQPGSMIASGSLVIPPGSIPAWHQSTLPATVLNPGQYYHFAFQPNPAMWLPRVVAGTSIPHHLQAPPAASGGWTPGNGKWAIQLICSDDSGDIDIGYAGLPYTGTTFNLMLRRAQRQGVVALSLGLSRTNYQGLPLPLDLSPLGAFECTVYNSIDATATYPVSPLGNAMAQVPIPSVPGLSGARFFAQWLVLEPRANPLGVILTSSLDCRIAH